MNDTRRIQRNSMGGMAPEDDAVDLGAMLGTLWRSKFLIALVVVMAVLLGGIYAYSVATPMYRSTAVVMLNNREEQVVDIGSVVGGLGSDTTVVNTEVEVLRSRVLLGKVVDQLELTQDPEFNEELRTPGVASQAKAFLTNLLPGSEDEFPEDAGTERAATINALLRNISIRNVSQSLVFQVTIETTDPVKSARIADSLTELYIEDQIEAKFEATEQATTWLTDRVAELQTSLEESEARVTDFRAGTDLVSSEALQALEVQLKDTRDRLANLRQQTAGLTERAEALEAAQTPEEQVAVTGDSQLEQLLPRIDNPSIASSFEARFQQLRSRALLEAERNASQIATLETAVEELQAQIESQSADLIELQQLTREAEATRLLYEYFLRRLNETSAQQGIQQADSRIISPAVVPQEAASPRKPLVLAMSAILGLIIAVAYVLMREVRDRAFRSADQLEKTVGYSTIGQVPLIPARQRKNAISYLRDKPSSAAAEAVRNLRTSLMLSNVDNPPQVIMTCSSLPGEGKTTIAMSLTQNFAMMGRKVLLIEGDIRRRVFGMYLESDQKEGIVSVLTGARRFEDVVIHDDLLGSDVLIGDKLQSNAADLFSSERFSSLLNELRESYDIIVIDTPPVLVVPDARVIAQHVDTIAFVVRWDSTQREQVQGALREFESVGKPVSGLVLNQISPKGMKRYGYGGGYGPYSSYGSKYYVS